MARTQQIKYKEPKVCDTLTVRRARDTSIEERDSVPGNRGKYKIDPRIRCRWTGN